jgi:hypothetical protein
MLGHFSKTRIVSRNGFQFQVPSSNFSSFRYLVHPDGTGTGWSNVEGVDVDQPHGKDYLYGQHIAKGVRKRINKEHKAFADNTVGGTHKPGGCAILDIVDQTVDISIDDDTYKGRNLIYDQTNNAFWCFTNTDGTASTPDGYLLKIHPDRAWDGGDVTWAGAHEFDASVDISGNTALDGDFSVDGTAVLTGLVTDGTAELSGRVINNGVIKAWLNFDGDDANIRASFNVTGVVRNEAGKYTITWATDFADTNYVVVGICGDAAGQGTVTFWDDAPLAVGSCVIRTVTAAGGVADYNNVHIMAIGNQV